MNDTPSEETAQAAHSLWRAEMRQEHGELRANYARLQADHDRLRNHQDAQLQAQTVELRVHDARYAALQAA
jgi:hypothetical protein